MNSQDIPSTFSRKLGRWFSLLLGLATSLLFLGDAEAARIKDIAYVHGVRDNQLLGYGLVVGLDGTGDLNSTLTRQSTASMLARLGIRVQKRDLRMRNVAVVMVTADLPAFAKSGQRLDVNVAAMGDARSLQGGQLLMTPLRGADGQVFAVAQGAVVTGGWKASAQGNQASKNHVTAGRVPEGALVERGVSLKFGESEKLRLHLHRGDFTTSVRVAETINALFDEAASPPADPAQKKKPEPSDGIASALDATTVLVEVPEPFRKHIPQFVATIEGLDVKMDQVAKVVINERTGTVVIGEDVEISTVAVAHGSLRVEVQATLEASQPRALARGSTAIVPNSDLDVKEGTGTLKIVAASARISDVVAALNAIGASPRELISILQAMRSAGALHARLEVQ